MKFRIILVVSLVIASSSLLAQKVDSLFHFGGLGINENLLSVSTDDQNNIYVPGSADYGLNLGDTTYYHYDPNIGFDYLIKFDQFKKRKWFKILNIDAQNIFYSQKIAVDRDHNVYVTNNVSKKSVILGKDTIKALPSGKTIYFTTKLDSNGNYTWTKNFGGQNLSIINYNTLEISNFKTRNDSVNGQAITNGLSSIGWIDLNGNIIDHLQLPSGNFSSVAIQGKDRDGHFYGFRRHSSGTPKSTALELFKVDSNGTWLDSAIFNYGAPGESTLMAHDPDGGYFLFGTFNDRDPFNAPFGTTNHAPFLIKTDDKFNILVKKALGPTSDGSITSTSEYFRLTVLANNVFLSGNVFSEVKYTAMGQDEAADLEKNEVFISKLDKNTLNLGWFRDFPSPYELGMAYNPISFKDHLLIPMVHHNTTIDQFQMVPKGRDDVIFLQVRDSDTNRVTISGKVFEDANANGVRDIGERGISYLPVQNKQFPANTFYTDKDGNYELSAVNGTQTIKVTNLPKYWNFTTPDSVIVITGKNDTDLVNVDFGIYPSPNTTDISTRLFSTSAARPGFIFSNDLTIVNEGTTVASGVVCVTLDKNLYFKSASVSPDSISGKNVYFSFSGLKIRDHFTVQMKDSLASISSLTGTNLIVTANAISSLKDSLESNNFFKEMEPITNSHDPNEMLVYPYCDITKGFINSHKELEYLVHFENTGNDTSIHAELRIPLDGNLDYSSFHFLASSHTPKIKLLDNILVVRFDSIMLPHQAANKVKCKGYFSYTILPKANLQIGDSILSHSNIYFDYNPKVQTNDAVSQVRSEKDYVHASTLPTRCKYDSNGSILLDAYCLPGEVRYSIDNKSFTGFNDTITGLSTGKHHLTVTNGLDTIEFDSLYVDNAVKIDTGVIMFGKTLIAEETDFQTSFQWIDCSNFEAVPGQEFQSVSGVKDGYYAVAISREGCKDTSGCYLLGNVGIHENNAHNKIIVYPNPGRDRLHLSLDVKQAFEMSIYNHLGQEILNGESNEKQTFTAEFTVSPGVYYLKVKARDGKEYWEIIIRE